MCSNDYRYIANNGLKLGTACLHFATHEYKLYTA